MGKKALPKLLEEAKDLNIPQRNCMEAKQEFEEVIVKTQFKYKDTFFENDAPIYTEYLNELKKQQIIDKRMHNQTDGEYSRKVYWDSICKSKVIDDGMLTKISTLTQLLWKALTKTWQDCCLNP